MGIMRKDDEHPAQALLREADRLVRPGEDGICFSLQEYGVLKSYIGWLQKERELLKKRVQGLKKQKDPDDRIAQLRGLVAQMEETLNDSAC